MHALVCTSNQALYENLMGTMGKHIY